MVARKKPTKPPPGIRARQLSGGRTAYDVRWTDGRGDRQIHVCFDLDEAIEYLADRRKEMRRGGHGDVSGGRMTLREFSRQWWPTRNVTKDCLYDEGTQFRNHVLSYFGDHRLVDITRQDVIDWLEWLDKSQHQAAETQARIRRLLSACLQAAVDEDLLHKNVVLQTKAPEIVHDERRFITPSEALLLEEHVDPWWQLMIPTMFDTATRISELARTNVSDFLVMIQRGKRQVYVPVHEVDSRPILGGSLRVRKGKTGNAVRVIPTITPSTAERLVAQILEHGQGPNSPLFQGRFGARLDPHNWRARAWNAAVVASGLLPDDEDPSDDDERKPTPHAMRHGGISVWIAAGTTDVFRLAKWAGHADERMIYKTRRPPAAARRRTDAGGHGGDPRCRSAPCYLRIRVVIASNSPRPIAPA